MKTFNIKSPSDWRLVGRDLIAFPSPGGTRNVRVWVNTEDHTDVYVHDQSWAAPILVGSAQGMFEIAYTAPGPDSALEFRTEGAVFVKAQTGSDFVQRKWDEVFTGLQPKGHRSSDLDRIMQFAKLNAAMQDAKHGEQLRKVEQSFEARIAEIIAREPSSAAQQTDENSAEEEDADEASQARDTASDTASA